MKHILGLDLGTNSIGWAVINATTDENTHKEQLIGINAAGSRIIPMDAAQLGDFNKGNTVSQTANRTQYRSTRRLHERKKLRRERLHRVLQLLGFLPPHYAAQLDRYGKFIANSEPKLAWVKNTNHLYHFIFQESFQEMLNDFTQADGSAKKIPYDWTLFYLRKKALTQKIKKEELAWILLNFNQKRGYHQLREEETEKPTSKTRLYFDSQTITDIVDTGETYKGLKIFTLTLANGEKGKWYGKNIPDWKGQKKDIIVSIDLDKNGNDKCDESGEPIRRFKIPTEQEWEEQWGLVKAKTEKDLNTSGKKVGTYIYDTLLQAPDQKIRGKLIRTIERKYYKEELYQILTTQEKFHPELQDKNLLQACIEELYPSNEAHRNTISKYSMSKLLVEDVIFYQRPLKSKKSLISDCPYEEHTYVDKETGEIHTVPVKCIAKSHPLFQEFRLWQFLSNLRIYQKEGTLNGKLTTDIDVTNEFLKNADDYVNLFDWLNQKKEIKQDAFFKYPAFGLKKNAANYRWNYVEDKTYPCNETHSRILFHWVKTDIDQSLLTIDLEEKLWHILYSISDKNELQKALQHFADKNKLGHKFVDTFQQIPPFKKDYGSYSAKAIKRLLPLMRMGKYWHPESIDNTTLTHIHQILNGEKDEVTASRIKGKAIHLDNLSSFQGLPTWLACYIVYNRHSEIKNITKWQQPSDIDAYLQSFKQHSLHNPIVEQIIMETLRTVRDIWKQIGHIDEIHVELGREMKNPADKRKKLTQQIQENENTNLRIKALLTEFVNPEFEIENVRPHSPSQQDLLRIYEEEVLNESAKNMPEDIATILKKFNETDAKKRPSTSDVLRYKCWLEQKYRSPYTGAMIPLGKLFTPAYEIEHIIPQSRYFDDSFTNKVICEAEVNKLKGNMLGYEFIKNNSGKIVELGFGQKVKIQTVEDYELFVKEHYSYNPVKMKKLLMEDIPEQFIQRQLNDSRYISKFIKSLLSNIVREEGESEATSKNIIVCTGGVTDRLKKDWGVNDVWNKIILPRFLRLNEITNSNLFTTTNTNNKIIPTMPLALQKGFNKKRIDHRHHAMDAIVIACANRNIVNYLSNESASKNAKISRLDLRQILCTRTKPDTFGNYQWIINKPWETFTQDVHTILENMIVSFKQNLRIINKTTNHYFRYQNGKKVQCVQETGDCWAIRKPMHKETVYGEINLRKITTVPLKSALENPQRIVEKDLKKKIKELLQQGLNEKQIKKYFEENKDTWQDVNLKKIQFYSFTKEGKERFFASRESLDTSFNNKKIEEKVADTGIQQILLHHLEQNNNDPNQAFSPEGIEWMNKNIISLNNGKWHQPIYKVRTYEQAEKFTVGQTGNKSEKFVEAAKGTNLFFAIYETEHKRSFASVSLNVVIERLKKGLSLAPENSKGNLPKYVLSPNDLVYVPTQEEIKCGHINQPIQKDRIYKMVSCTEGECHFIPYFVANPIIQTIELGSNNKAQKSWQNEMIKEICIPIKIDRLGNITSSISL
ncbi:MAG: type II CRISPR RNA-guided endonuclease Cas9 [Candidatus Phocaeicola merdigallinarum]|nr:type II CRISPR RNA-guided endonuclease Cas9 [Candidatus Phocaeicola merdigallinarum]